MLTPFVAELHGLRGATAQTEGDIQRLAAMIDDGKLTPVLDRAFGLDEAAAAIDYLASGRARGRIVITP